MQVEISIHVKGYRIQRHRMVVAAIERLSNFKKRKKSWQSHGVKYVYLLPSNSLYDSHCLHLKCKSLNMYVNETYRQSRHVIPKYLYIRTGNALPGKQSLIRPKRQCAGKLYASATVQNAEIAYSMLIFMAVMDAKSLAENHGTQPKLQ